MLTDVGGLRVGHAQRVGEGWCTGVTVVVPPPGTVGAVDVRGGGPGTHETDALAPGTLVDSVDAVTLCGGSAYGLVATRGAQRWCEREGLGFPVGLRPDGTALVVPIVPGAAIFDLGRGGDPDARPDEAMGFHAAAAATGGAFARGQVGAGTGARTASGSAPGGLGTASRTLPGGVVVAALVVVNAAGRVRGRGEFLDPTHDHVDLPVPTSDRAPLNTTLAVIATTARLDVAAAQRTAGAGHDGLARTISPVHTLMDGDTVFTLATGVHDCAVVVEPGGAADGAAQDQSSGWPGARRAQGLAALQAAAAEVVAEAVWDAVAQH